MRTDTSKSLDIHDDLQQLRRRMSEMGIRDNELRSAVIDHCADAVVNDAAVDLAATELDYTAFGVQVVLYRQAYPDQPARQIPAVTITG